MGKITVGVVRERAPGERRVAMVPESVARLNPAGIDVLVETGAGASAWFSDDDYAAAGAKVVADDELYEQANVVLCVGPPDESKVRAGQTVIGMLEPLRHPGLVRRWAERGVTAVSLDMLPRTLSRAQTMDALTSQENIAGYKAVLVAAGAFGRYFPMLTTAAGTSKPAAVLVLGAGVAGLQAIGTARRLGAVVTAYDVRPECKQEVESLGARFLDLADARPGSAARAEGTGGYARALTASERAAEQRVLAERIAGFDVVITTARVPGRRPPVLVTAAALGGMRPGSVVVDLAASDLGGNVEASEPGRHTVLENGVTVIGAQDLPSAMAPAASAAYARNIGALLTHLMRDGAIVIDPSDEIQADVVITHQGTVINRAVADTLDGQSGTGGAQ